ncbi:MAG: hypothetical protein R3E03_06385 [Novosphingobium sp.]
MSEADHIAWIAYFFLKLAARAPATIEFLRTQGMALLRKSLARIEMLLHCPKAGQRPRENGSEKIILACWKPRHSPLDCRE